MNTTALNKIIPYLQETPQFEHIGLVGGKMGYIINLYSIARLTSYTKLADIADDLLDQIYDEINPSMKIFLSDGLSGIGLGIESLIDNNFVEADSDVVDELDTFVLEITRVIRISNFDFLSGYLGVCYCLIDKIRQYLAKNPKQLRILEIKLSLISLIDSMLNLIKKNKEIFIEPLIPDIYWILPHLLRTNIELFKLNIFNFKVNSILQILSDKISKLEIVSHFNRFLIWSQMIELLSTSNYSHLSSQYANNLRALIDRDCLEKEISKTNNQVQLKFFLSSGYLEVSEKYNEYNFREEAKYWLNSAIDDIKSLPHSHSATEILCRLGFNDGFFGFNKFFYLKDTLL